MKKIFIPLILVSMIILSCGKKMLVQDNNGVVPEKYNSLITYNLPKTLLKIKIPIEISSFKKGLIDTVLSQEQKIMKDFVFENYGWLPIKIPKTEKTFSIGDKIQFIPITIPDGSKQFTISYSGSKALSNSMGITLTKDGIISSGEFAQEDKTFEYVTKGLEATASIAGKFFGLGSTQQDLSKIQKNTDFSTHYNRFVNLTKELNALNQSKSDLIKSATNAVPTINPTKYRLDLIDKRITQIKDEIMGTNKKTIINISLVYEPGKTIVKPRTLLKIDPEKGYIIEGAKDTPLMEGALSEKTDGEFKNLSIYIEEVYTSQKIKNEFRTTAEYGKHFLVYNLPAKYSVQLLFNGKALKSYANAEDEKGTDLYEIYFPQKGTMGAMPFDFKDSKVVFYEDIGAIKEIKYVTNATLNTTSITQGSAALDSIVSLRNKYKESKKEEIATVEETKEQVIRLIIEQAQPVLNPTPPTN